VACQFSHQVDLTFGATFENLFFSSLNSNFSLVEDGVEGLVEDNRYCQG